MSVPAVLHVTSFPGGGVDRYIRDIARTTARRHLVWHVGDGAQAIEIAGEQRYYPLARTALNEGSSELAAWLRAQGVGLVHAHSVSEGTRERVQWARRELDIKAIATLHDVLFLRP